MNDCVKTFDESAREAQKDPKMFSREKHDADIRGAYDGTRKAIHHFQEISRKQDFHRKLAFNCLLGAFFGLFIVFLIFKG